MARISARRLNPKLQNRMFYIFWKSLAELTQARELEFLTNDLFSPVEKIMITKRFLVAILLLQGASFRQICNLLKVSPNTVNNVSKKIRGKSRGFSQILSHLLRHRDVAKFVESFS